MTPPVVVIGGSAGALDPLLALAGALPADLPAAVLVVIHLPPDRPSMLPQLLARSGPLQASHAADGGSLEAGKIYVAPPDHHLLVAQGQVRLSRGPRENRSRPSIDVLFRSAAYTLGPQVAGVLLSGMQDDGTSGLWAVHHFGGLTLVQHPEEATYSEMPLSAIRSVEVDEILTTQALATRLSAWARAVRPQEPMPARNAHMDEMDEPEIRRIELEIGIATQDNAFKGGVLNQGTLSPFTCPECHGVLVQLKEGRMVRYRCHTGHAYTARTLISELREAAEARLWDAARVLDENVMLLEHLSKHALEADALEEAEDLKSEAHESQMRGQAVRQLALRLPLDQVGAVDD